MSIDWKLVITQIETQDGDVVSFDNTDNIPVGVTGFSEITQSLIDAKYNFDVIKWIDYYPEKHFDISVEQQFAAMVNCGVCRSWISRVDPGYYAPRHWDVDSNLSEYLKMGQLKRFSCFITDPKFGQVLIVEDECLYNKPINFIYEWPKYNAWHAASNAGLDKQYLYQFLGYSISG